MSTVNADTNEKPNRAWRWTGDTTRLRLSVLGLLLAVLTVAAYGRIWSNGFIDYDDPGYVFQNSHVRDGLTGSGVAWAFTTTKEANWHPLTWVSLMLDATLGGVDPRVFHGTNLFLHVANAFLLLLFLNRTTGSTSRSGLVAALFAVHPLHVESVAWAAERKDVLSTFFWLVTMIAYARYTARPSPARYLLVFASLALGLLAKPMLVSLPLVLLLLDYWPLGRWEPSRFTGMVAGKGRGAGAYGATGARTGAPASTPPASDASVQSLRPGSPLPPPRATGLRGAMSLLLEKAPLFALAVVSCVLTVLAQKNALQPLESYPFVKRLGNALVSYAAYLGKTFWPQWLSIFYQYPRHPLPPWQFVVAAGFLLGVSILSIVAARKRPWLPVGWFWYVTTLVPVIGIVQVGSQAMADRYTYVPLIGIFIVVAWAVPDLSQLPRSLSHGLAVVAAALVLCLAARTWFQVACWRSTVDVFTHATEATTGNAVAHTLLAGAYAKAGDEEQSVAHIREALRIAPNFAEAHYELTRALLRRRKIEEAAPLCEEEVALWPSDERTLVDLGMLEMAKRNYDEAATRFAEVIRMNPDSVDAHMNLALIYSNQRRFQEFMREYSKVVELVGPEQAQELASRSAVPR